MGIYKDRENKYWVYKFQYSGKQYGGRGYGTRRDAEAARVKRREEVKKDAVAAIKKEKTATDFSAIANEYLDYAQRKYVTDVYKRKANVCRRFLKMHGDLALNQITPRHAHDYLKTLTSNSLYNEQRQELSSLFNWAKKTYAAQLPLFVNPCQFIESMSHVTAEKKIPTQEQVLRMIAAATPGDERDILLVCIQTLGRIDEILRLRWHEDVNFDKRYVVLWTRKRKNGAYEPDALPMNKDLYDVLMSRWKARKQDKWVFWNEKAKEGKGDRFMHRPRMMASICRRAGVPFFGFHSLRHFMASYLLDEEKVSLKTVSGLLRHKQVRTTEIYLHSLDTSHVTASDKIEGKFTLKLAKPPQEAATEKSGGDTQRQEPGMR